MAILQDIFELFKAVLGLDKTNNETILFFAGSIIFAILTLLIGISALRSSSKSNKPKKRVQNP